ncbi:MAG: type II/IV secretion system ATPase subunit [Candidatus Bathyarchaeia archaeon]|jgi:flagellar protein FlaI
MSEEEKSKEEKRSSKGLRSLFELRRKSATSASAKKELALRAKISNQKKSKKAENPNSSKFAKVLLKEKTPENPAVTFKNLSEGTRIVEKYAIEEPYSNIQIVQPPELGGGKAYYIEEVELEENEKLVLVKLFDIISKEIEPSKNVKNQIEQMSNEARRLALKYGLDKKITSESWNKILYYLHRNLVGYGDIDVIMKDAMIEDLSINGLGTPLYVWHRKYESIPTNLTFTDESSLNNLIIKLTHMSGKHISTAFPLLDAMLPGKDRLAATFKREVSPKGSSISIRRFREEPFSIIDLIELGTINEEIGAYFWLLIENRATLAIIGGTGAGKTSTLNAIASLVKPSMKIVTVEEIPELNIPHENWVQLVSRESYGLGEMKTGSVSLFELVKTSLRYRPDYIVVGEIRGEEAFVLFQALATGHGGLTTFHADSLDYTVKRLTSPPMNVAEAYIPLINVAVLVERVQLPISSSALVAFGRRVKAVQEVVEFEKYKTISTWDPITDTFSVNLKNSKQLSIIAAKHGVPLEDVLSEIQARAGLLRQLRASGIRKNVDLAKSITAYYLQEKYLNVRALNTDDDKLTLKTEEQKR